MIRKIGPSEHRRMPWRNGGGSTTEILVEPAGPGAAAPFRHRLSIADVASDGPFSTFPGCDRHIVVLDGAGMRLDCGEHGAIELRRHEPRTFSGDWAVRGALVAGPVRDLNLIVARDLATSTIEVRRVEQASSLVAGADAICIVHVIEGAIEGADVGGTVVFDESYDVVVRDPAVLAIGRVTARPTR